MNWVLGESEDIGKTIISSLLFTGIYSVLVHFLRKSTKESESNSL